MAGKSVLVSMLAVVMSGCLAATDSPGDPPGDKNPLLLPPDLGRVLNIGPGADAESSIDVSPDGQTILVCSHGGFTQPSPLWVSKDAGATFERVEPEPNQPFNGDCDVSIAPDGAWSIVYDTVASATVAVSTDKGSTWTVQPFTAYPVVGGVDRPWIHTVSQSTLYMTYKSVGGGQPELDIFAVSTDGGVSWTQRPYFVPMPPARNSAIPGDMHVSDNGRTIRVPFIVSPQDDGDQVLENAVSRDGGQTWTTETIATGIPEANGIPGGGLAGDGTLYFSYGTQQSDSGDVMVAYSKDDGKTWSEPTAAVSGITFGGLLEGNVWIDGRPDGSATAFWVERRTDADGVETWQHAAARVNVSDGFRVDWNATVGIPATPHASDLYEFATVRHDELGRAYFAFPGVTSRTCKQTPMFPSQVGSQNIPRNTACQYVVIENVTVP